MNKRPLPVTFIGCLCIVIGVVGVAYHSAELMQDNLFHYDALGIEAIRLLAIVSGVFLLRGHNWARWLTVAWIGLHVVVSAFHAFFELALHCLFFCVIAWVLFRADAQKYFRAGQNDEQASL